MYFICAATIALFAANCSGGGSSTPSGVVKSFYSKVQKGDYEGALAEMYNNAIATATDEQKASVKDGDKEKQIKALAAKAKAAVEMKGGMKSYEVTDETISEDGQSATVSIKLVYGDGTNETEKMNCIKKDGKWILNDSL